MYCAAGHPISQQTAEKVLLCRSATSAATEAAEKSRRGPSRPSAAKAGIENSLVAAAQSVCVRTRSSLRDFESILPLYPALKRWAKLGRPSGAEFFCVSFYQTARKRFLKHTEALHPITPKPGVLGTPALRHPKSDAALRLFRNLFVTLSQSDVTIRIHQRTGETARVDSRSA
jgi:hypothetical protein